MTKTVRTIEALGPIAPGVTRFYAYMNDGSKPRMFHGTTVEGRTCGARCRNSLGPSCSCSCGGHNHGRSLIEP